MTMSLTFDHLAASHAAKLRWPIALLTAMMVAGPASVSACDKAVPMLVASASPESRGTGVFTGEFVNGVPVYRLPSINVVAHRPAEVAKAKREDSSGRTARPRPSSAAGSAAAERSFARDSREANPIKPCAG